MANETEEERLLRENFDPDVLMGRRPFGKRIWNVPPLSQRPDAEGEQKADERPRLVLIRGDRAD